VVGRRQYLIPHLIVEQERNFAGFAEHDGALLCDQNALQQRPTAGCLTANVSPRAGGQDESLRHVANALQARPTGSAVSARRHTAQ